MEKKERFVPGEVRTLSTEPPTNHKSASTFCVCSALVVERGVTCLCQAFKVFKHLPSS